MTNEQALQWFRFKFDRAKDYYDEHWDAAERREHKEYVEAMKCAIKALTDNAELKAADVQPAPKWISVKDRLPDELETEVLVWIKDGRADGIKIDDSSHIAYWLRDDKIFLDLKYNEVKGITHWMPLPEPPKDDDVEAENETK